MFGNKEALYLRNLKTGNVYKFVLQETEDKIHTSTVVDLGQAIKQLQVEKQTFKQRVEDLERTMEHPAKGKEIKR